MAIGSIVVGIPVMPSGSLLTPTQQATAHEYWQTLLFPPSHHQLHAARRGLKSEEAIVIDAVMDALVLVWDRARDPLPEENPFTGREPHQPTPV